MFCSSCWARTADCLRGLPVGLCGDSAGALEEVEALVPPEVPDVRVLLDVGTAGAGEVCFVFRTGWIIVS